MKMPRRLPILLGFLTAVGPVSTDMYLPAFPAIEASLGGRPGTAQITLATWFAGLAFGQIAQGTLSDRFGRRRPLMIGTIIYTLGSIGCALSTSLFALALFRFVAALGGSASMVIPRAIVRDMAEGHEAVRLMSRLMLIMGVTPILAPTLGGLVLGFGASWHVIFWAAAAYGALGTVLVWRKLPDTLPRTRRIRLGPIALVHRYGLILRDRTFITCAAIAGCCTFTMFAYVGGSPPIFIDLYQLSPPQYGLLFGANASCYIFAAQLNARLVQRIGLARGMTMSVAAFVVSTAAAALVAWSRIHSLMLMMLPLTAMWASLGFLSPSAAVGALTRHAKQAASASALMGTMQFVLGACSSISIALLIDGSARPMATLLLLGALGAMLANKLRPALPDRIGE